MDHSLLSAGRNVHLKIVGVAVASAIVVLLVGVNARTLDVALTNIQSRGVVIEAGRAVTHARLGKEHTTLPLKQPHSPIMLGAVNKHLATFKEFVPPVPMQ